VLLSPQIIAGRRRRITSSFTPLDLGAKLRAWWDYTDTSNLWQNDDGTGAVSSDTDPIGRVTDKSGNGKHLIQATSGNKPAYRTGPGRVRFDGSNDYLSIASAAFPIDEYELFYVMSQHATKTNNAGIVIFAPSSGNDYQSASGIANDMGVSSQFMGVGANSGQINTYMNGTPPAPLSVWEHVKTASTFALRKNGANEVTDNSFTAMTSPHSGNFYVGCRFLSGAVSGAYGPIDLRDMIMTAGLTSDERTSVRDYLYTKHGITP
jgi:hypothetical protein